MPATGKITGSKPFNPTGDYILSAKNKREVKISPAGQALWPKLTEPDTKFKTEGEYSVKLLVSEAEAREFITLCDAVRERAVEMCVEALQAKHPKLTAAKAKEKTVLYEHPVKPEEDPETGLETGNYTVNFKMTASGANKKTGKPWSRRPVLFDAKKRPIDPGSIEIWNGSRLKVAYSPSPWHNPKNECGCSLKLEAVQVLELVNGGNRDYDFGEEEGGYSHSDEANPPFNGFPGAGEGAEDDGEPEDSKDF
jgi:hypothetical protein